MTVWNSTIYDMIWYDWIIYDDIINWWYDMKQWRYYKLLNDMLQYDGVIWHNINEIIYNAIIWYMMIWHDI